MGKTIVEKIVSVASGSNAAAGVLVITPVSRIMLHDATGPLALDVFDQMEIGYVKQAERVTFVFDHFIPSPAETYSRMQDRMRRFAARMNIQLLEGGEGICHQLLPEKGLVMPGTIAIGTDSHTCTYGAIGALATGVGSTDAAVVLATGKTWLKVPETIRVELKGLLPKGVLSKDFVLRLAKDLRADGATYMAIEIGGPGLSNLSMDSRFTVCNMGVEMGAKACIMEVDDIAEEWVKQRCTGNFTTYLPDPDARYNRHLCYDLSNISPQVACPHTVDNVTSIEDLGSVPIAQGVIGTCTNGRMEDLWIAAKILKGKKIAPGVRLIVIPASRTILLEAIEAGIIETLISAGAMILPPGCGPCVGGHGGIPADGENVISTANRNFKGRMGNAKANIYLASPATVAASVIEGRIVDPRPFMEVC